MHFANTNYISSINMINTQVVLIYDILY